MRGPLSPTGRPSAIRLGGGSLGDEPLGPVAPNFRKKLVFIIRQLSTSASSGNHEGNAQC